MLNFSKKFMCNHKDSKKDRKEKICYIEKWVTQEMKYLV